MIRLVGHNPRLSVRRLSLSGALLGALTASGIALSSCQVAAGHGDGVGSLQFQDVVVPDGFRLKDRAHESYSREEASWRHGHFVYAGTGPVDRAAAYVLLRMPQHNWSVTNEEVIDDEGMRLRFERGIYSADYVFSRKDGNTRMVVDYTTDYAKR